MRLIRMLIREAVHHRANSVLTVLAAAVAVAALVSATTVLDAHDRATDAILQRQQQEVEQIMARLQDDMRKAMLKLSFNLLIVPEQQDLKEWYTEDAGSLLMPEEYVHRLADSGIVTVRHMLPTLQQKVPWPEQNRTILLIGTRGEVPNLHKNPKKPLIQPVESGTIVLGHELHRTTGLSVGDTATFMGRAFRVAMCHAERGSKDDISAWISLEEAQELLGKEGRINAILALECLCAGKEGLARIRAEVTRILPGTRVVESGTKALARAESRFRVGEEASAQLDAEKRHRQALRVGRERVAFGLVCGTVLACGAWIAFLGARNARSRRHEIGMLRVLGFGTGAVLKLFMGKAILLASVGAGCGLVTGIGVGRWLGWRLEGVTPAALAAVGGWIGVASALLAAVLLTTLAEWIPLVLALHEDPADVLRDT